MSYKELHNFIDHLNQNPSLCERVDPLLNDYNYEEIVKLGRERGYIFEVKDVERLYMEVAYLESNEHYQRAKANNLLFIKVTLCVFFFCGIIGLFCGDLYLAGFCAILLYFCIFSWNK